MTWCDIQELCVYSGEEAYRRSPLLMGDTARGKVRTR
jgi:hypothetical protein